MNLIPRIEQLTEKKLAGLSLPMSLADNKTQQLWKSFMPRRKEILHPAGTDLFSLQVYEPDYFSAFRPDRIFIKWAAMEVTDWADLPQNMEAFTLPGGLYAVFDYKGMAGNPAVFSYIFGEWLPGSGYMPDNRPHFEVLGERYRNNDPESEEEIWIPVKPL